MALLDKQITKDEKIPKKVKSREHSKVDINFEINSSANEIDRFSISVLKVMVDSGVPPTPDNFKIYFEKLLETKSLDFQKKIQELLEFEESSYSENRVEIEKDVKEIFRAINSIIKVVNSIYKNIKIIKQLSDETGKELSSNANSLIIKNVAMGFKDKLDMFVKSMDNQLETLKQKYQKAGDSFKSIENSTIFDTRFGVYNKRYFIEQAKQERQKIIKFHHQSSIVVIQVKDSVLRTLSYQKDKIFLLRIIAKMLLKTSRRNDIISYFGENCFILLLRHTDAESTKMACERIYEMLVNSNIVLNDKEIEMDVGIGISLIKSSTKIEESISCALKAMDETGKGKATYKICEDKQEEKND